MIYLKQFQIPSDLWVDWYFSPTPWGPDDSLILLDEPENSLSAMWQKELGCIHSWRSQGVSVSVYHRYTFPLFAFYPRSQNL